MKNRHLMTALVGFAMLNACSSSTPVTGTGGEGAGTGGISATGGSGSGGERATGGAGPGTGGKANTGGTSTGGLAPATGGAGGATSTGGASGGGTAGGDHWVGTWTGSPYPVPSDAQPPSSLSDSVVRQVVHVSLGGSKLRVQFSNASGNGPVTIKMAHLAICKATPGVDSTIDVSTDKALSFSGMPMVTIAQGKEVWSDSVDFTVAALGNISITTAFGSVPSNLTGHAGARTTSYMQSASTDVSAASMTKSAGEHWYYISGIDVMAPASAVGAVAIGDSITDGRGTDNNKNNRWTDVLAARLHANAATANVAMMNQGIGATNLIGSGTGAESRFARDVLAQSGVKYAIVYDGVNDIGGSASFMAMKTVYDKLIAAAHAKNVVIFGATIPPFNGNSYYSAGHEDLRKQVNTYIKGGAFDGVIDFDMALTDGKNPPSLQATYADWSMKDGLHPGPAGYQKMGETADLALFTK